MKKKIDRDYLEVLAVCKDKRRKDARYLFSLDEARYINTVLTYQDYEYVRVYRKNFMGTIEDFENMLG